MSKLAIPPRWLVTVTTCLILFSVAGDPIFPPSKSDVVGAWMGYENGGVYFYRLAFEKRGHGTCEAVFADNTVDSYLITRWQMTARKLEIHLSPVTSGQERIRIDVVALDYRTMEITISGVDQKWQQRATLFNEQQFLKKLDKSKGKR